MMANDRQNSRDIATMDFRGNWRKMDIFRLRVQRCETVRHNNNNNLTVDLTWLSCAIQLNTRNRVRNEERMRDLINVDSAARWENRREVMTMSVRAKSDENMNKQQPTKLIECNSRLTAEKEHLRTCPVDEAVFRLRVQLNLANKMTLNGNLTKANMWTSTLCSRRHLYLSFRSFISIRWICRVCVSAKNNRGTWHCHTHRTSEPISQIFRRQTEFFLCRFVYTWLK